MPMSAAGRIAVEDVGQAFGSDAEYVQGRAVSGVYRVPAGTFRLGIWPVIRTGVVPPPVLGGLR